MLICICKHCKKLKRQVSGGRKMVVNLPGIGMVSTSKETKFQCKRCNRCCEKRNGQIVLSPMDVTVISEFLDISREEFIRLKTIRVNYMFVPQIALKTYGKKEQCCFLDRTGCTIHEVSPFQCYTFPIIPIDEEKKLYVQQKVKSYCGKEGSTISIEEWLEKNKRYRDEKEQRKFWNEATDVLDKHCKRLPKERLEKIFHILYENENHTLEQLKANVEECYKIC